MNIENIEFRSILPEEADEVADIEQICFPPNEACSRETMKIRVLREPEMFLVAYDKSTGMIAGYLNGTATDEERFSDDFLAGNILPNSDGCNVMLAGLAVRPEYRMRGIAAELVRRYAERERANGRKRLVLTCLDFRVEMYKKMGFIDLGLSDSVWGGEEWHEMELNIQE